MSFPDPHHPWDPPASEKHRCNWRDLDLPAGHPGTNEEIERVLAQKPAHWLALWKGEWVNAEGGPGSYRPQKVGPDNIREINAMTHIMNEMIDEACGRVLARIAQRGWDDDTDVIFTTDHGELQGDYGLVFKGPFHTDSLMRLPMVWRPAPSAGVAPAVVREPVGQLDLAPTFCEIAGVPTPEWVQGAPLPEAPGSSRERVLCEWDSQFPGYGMHLRSIYRDGWLCTVVREVDDRRAERPREVVRGDGHVRRRHRPREPGRVRGHRGRALRGRRGPAPVRATAGTTRSTRRSARTSSPTSTTRCPPSAASSRSSAPPDRTCEPAQSAGKRRRFAVCVAIAQRLPCSSHRRAGPVA